MLFYVLATLISVLLWYVVWPLSYWKRLGVKQGILFKLKSSAEMVELIYKMFPKERYSGFYQFNKPILVIRDPELIKLVAVRNFDHFTDHFGFGDPSIDPLWGRNLFSLKGNNWRNMRATLSGSFTSSKMQFMFNLITETAENFTEYFDGKNENLIELEIRDAYTRFANDVIATTAFGIKVDSLKDQENEFYLMGKQATNMGTFKAIIKLFLFFVAPKLAKFFKIKIFEKHVAIFFRSLINETIEMRESKGILRPDMINLLLEARKDKNIEETDDELDTGFATVQEEILSSDKSKHKIKLTNEDITAHALIFFFAGFDTISAALCFASYELATHPEIQQKIRKEIDETLEACNGKLTYEALLKMKYMDMVVTESLRLWAPIVATDRVCVKPFVIEPTKPEEKPIRLEIDTMIWIPIYGIHRDPAYYPEPEKFIPERFSEENKHNIQPYTYMPFGVGPRNCIGSRFALLEFKAVMFNLLLKYEIVPTKKTDIPLKLKSSPFQHTAANGWWFGLRRIKK